MSKCGYCGQELTTGDGLLSNICKRCFDNTSQIDLSKEVNKQIESAGLGFGWECPRCHTIWAPYISHCNCPPPVKKIISDNSSSG